MHFYNNNIFQRIFYNKKHFYSIFIAKIVFNEFLWKKLYIL